MRFHLSQRKNGAYHTWWAWRPVLFKNDNQVVWLEPLLRRWRPYLQGGEYGTWEYLLPNGHE